MDDDVTGRILTAPRVFTGETVLTPGWVHVDGGHVLAADTGRPPTGPPVEALPSGWLAPGFVDLQCNGGLGIDFTDRPPREWEPLLRRLPTQGVTSVVPTLVSAPLAVLADQLAAYREARGRPPDDGVTARTLGLHLEGPFLSPRRRGAHAEALLRHPTPRDIRQLLTAADDGHGGVLAYLTLAPEVPGAVSAIRHLTAAGVRVSLGHTDADAETVRRALTAGATLVTHLFNAQRPFHHRDPGVVGVALGDPRPVCGLIADLQHVDASGVRFAFAALGDRVALVTDATAATGMPPGRHTLGGGVIDARGDRPPVRADGTLAGSVLTMDGAVRNAVSCGIDVVDALAAASCTPARALGRRDLGRIGSGSAADLVWLSDDLDVLGTWVAGRLSPAGSRS